MCEDRLHTKLKTMNFRMKKYKKQIFNFILIFSLLSFSVCPIFAQGTLRNASDNLSTFGGDAGFDKNKTDIDVIIGSVIKYLLSFLGVIFLILLVYGGFTWMTARGDSEAVKKSKDIMVNAIIGLAIVLGAYMLTNWIIRSLVQSTLAISTTITIIPT